MTECESSGAHAFLCFQHRSFELLSCASPYVRTGLGFRGFRVSGFISLGVLGFRGLGFRGFSSFGV